MQRNTLLAIAGACLSLSGTAAMAADGGPRYTYGEVGYSHVDFDDFDADGEVWNIKGSFALTDMFFATAGYADGDLDVDSGGDSDYTNFDLGAGINYPLSGTMDLVGKLSYISVDTDAGDEDGYGIYAGVRAMLTPQFELNGGLDYTDLGDPYDSNTAVDVGVVYNFTDMFAVTGDFSFSDDYTTYGIGARLYFGAR